MNKFACIVLFVMMSLTVMQAQNVDIQGHRGCRGLLPENSVPAFIKAVALGVTTLELDVVISKDQQVVVSHDPYLNPVICLNPQGEEIQKEHAYALYQMDYQEIAQCDCGSRQHPDFPEQQPQQVVKPLLSQVIDTVEAYLQQHQLSPVYYNIETKLSPESDGKLHPAPAQFVDLLMEVIKQKNIRSRVIIQSFDERTLQYAHQKYPNIPLALLIENQAPVEKNLARLGFTPAIYSPYYRLVDKSLIKWAQQKDMQVIPWTVNQSDDIRRMLDLQVDGIISDYPDRVIDMIED